MFETGSADFCDASNRCQVRITHWLIRSGGAGAESPIRLTGYGVRARLRRAI